MEKKIKKIAILGAESTGKTTLTEQLAEHYNTVFVPEYARNYFDKNDIKNYALEELIIIANNQLELEKEMEATANKLLFCDTTLITIKIWALNQFNKVPDIISKAIKATDYDLYLICNNDVPWKEDLQRRNEDLREHFFKWTKHELQKQNIDYQVIKGLNNARLELAIHSISTMNLNAAL